MSYVCFITLLSHLKIDLFTIYFFSLRYKLSKIVTVGLGLAELSQILLEATYLYVILFHYFISEADTNLFRFAHS